MINNQITLKTTAEDAVVRKTEINSISVNCNNCSVNIGEQETVIDLSGDAVKFPEKYTTYGFGVSSPSAPGVMTAQTEEERVKNEALAQAIINLVKTFKTPA